MVFYSHIWDGLLKLISLVGLVIAAVHLNVEVLIRSGGIIPDSASVFIVVGVVGIVWVIMYRQCVSIFSSWLYATLSLGANVTLAEAKALRKLFQLDLSARWVPLREVKTLPKDQRHDALLNALETYGTGRRAMLL